jgi:hypothetical protein
MRRGDTVYDHVWYEGAGIAQHVSEMRVANLANPAKRTSLLKNTSL